MTGARSDDRLAGKVVVVTGAGTASGVGNGQAIALTMARHGAAIVCVDKVAERAAAVAETIVSEDGRAIAVAADVTLVDDCERIADDALSAFGRVDGLVNCAGIVSRTGLAPRVEGGVLGELEHLDLEDWDLVYRVNVTGAMLCIRALGPALRRNGGAVVNVGTTVASRWYGGGGSLAYGTAKAGLEGLTLSIAGAFGPDRVRANLLVIGQVRAPHIDAAAQAMGDAGAAFLESRRLSGLLQTDGTPWDVADAALFLVSDESSWITAQTLYVDAGASKTMR